MGKVAAYLRLMRPANIITAIADILLGFAASGALLSLTSSFTGFDIGNIYTLAWLVLATVGLYGGGVVINDVFDADLDRIERPERPIPSGMATVTGAAILGASLLLMGIVAAWQVSLVSALVATSIAVLALLYDWKGKHHALLGPINMGACRGGNLLLGVSAVPAALESLWFMALIPIVYIAAITMVSRGEVHGGNKTALKGAAFMYTLVFAGIVSLSVLPQFNVLYSIPFLILFAFIVFPPLLRAMPANEPSLIIKAVKAGILALIVMNASIAAGFAGLLYGLTVLALLPVSLYISRKFAVT